MYSGWLVRETDWFRSAERQCANWFAIISWIIGFHYEVAQSGYDWPAGRWKKRARHRTETESSKWLKTCCFQD
jgi:hypothetical protein